MNETWSYGEAAEPGVFPWPPPEDGGALEAFGETWKSATLDPTTFFRAMPRKNGTGAAILYYLILGILVAGVSLFWDLTGAFTGAAGDAGLASELGMDAVNPLIGFLLSPVFLLFALFVGAGVTHVVLLLFGGASHGYTTTVRVFSYAYSPMVFGVVPFLGALVGSVWMVVLCVIGVREAHGTEGWKAAIAVLLPVLLAMGLVFMAAFFVAMAGAAILAS